MWVAKRAAAAHEHPFASRSDGKDGRARRVHLFAGDAIHRVLKQRLEAKGGHLPHLLFARDGLKALEFQTVVQRSIPELPERVSPAHVHVAKRCEQRSV